MLALAIVGGAQAEQLTRSAGVCGGLVVVLETDDVSLLVELAAGESFLVFALDTDAARVDRARSKLRERGICGRVTVNRAPDFRRLPLVGEQVRLLAVTDPAISISRAEA
jgi:hypothetical protein